MSLASRVQRTAAFARQDYADGRANDDTQTFELLRSGVQAIIPAAVITQVMRDNPQRAENEIRSACKKVFAQGALPATSNQQEQLTDRLINLIFGFGPLQELLEDSSITEIMVNGCNSLFFERDGVLQRSAIGFSDDSQVRAIIDKILGPLGRRIDEASPMVNARLPQGHRVHAIIPPLALDGPILTIRKFSESVIELDRMVNMGSMDEAMNTFLTWAVVARKNIAVSGGTGSGKTTLLNALSCKIPAAERIITIEDSAELRFLTHPHVVRLEARPQNAEGKGRVSIRSLVVNALRMRPDRIIVGECRDEEALDMLQAMNTGHDGSLTTLHANSPHDAILRLTTMVRYAADLPIDAIEAQIGSALDVIVQVVRDASGVRYVQGVSELTFHEADRSVKVLPLFVREDARKTGVWQHIPSWIDSLAQNIASSKEVAAWKQLVQPAA